MQQTKSPCNIFTCFSHYFQLNLDENSLLCNGGEQKVIESKYKTRHEKIAVTQFFSITVLRVGSAAGVNGPVIFLVKGENVHHRLRGENLEGFPEVSCAILNKSAYMDDEAWEKVMKVVAPGIRKIKVSNISCALPILFSIYLTLCICTSKLSGDDVLFPKGTALNAA